MLYLFLQLFFLEVAAVVVGDCSAADVFFEIKLWEFNFKKRTCSWRVFENFIIGLKINIQNAGHKKSCGLKLSCNAQEKN